MPKFIVKPGQTVDSGKVYAAGDTLELTQEQADAMPWAVEPAPMPVAKSKADLASAK